MEAKKMLGRPSCGDKMARLTINLPQETIDTLKEQAKQNGMSISKTLKIIIEQSLEDLHAPT